MKPLISIIIPAYNAEATLRYSIESAIHQTWPRKEIIVIDDGSKDRTAEIAESYLASGVSVVSTENRGLSAAVNYGYKLSRGDYIQELDSDDVLAPDKIEKQLGALRSGDGKRVLLSSAWAHFYYRTRRARFIQTSLWEDLCPVEWLVRKLSENLFMQNATWLVSRELAEAAGPWDEDLCYDQDGEYFARVVMASEGTRFAPEAKIFYRRSDSKRVSCIGRSVKKMESQLRSMKLHIQYLRSLEDSERVRKACLIYLQNWMNAFYRSEPAIEDELRNLAMQLNGQLEAPRLRWKYGWIELFFGYEVAGRVQTALPEIRNEMTLRWDKAMSWLESR